MIVYINGNFECTEIIELESELQEKGFELDFELKRADQGSVNTVEKICILCFTEGYDDEAFRNELIDRGVRKGENIFLIPVIFTGGQVPILFEASARADFSQDRQRAMNRLLTSIGYVKSRLSGSSAR